MSVSLYQPGNTGLYTDLIINLESFSMRLRLPLAIKAIAPVVVLPILAIVGHGFSPQSACAQTSSYQDCVADLIALGVSPDVAAQQCNNPQSAGTSCAERLMFQTAQATSGPTPEGRWRFSTVGDRSGEDMRAAGCSNEAPFSSSPWRCPTQTMRIQVMDAAEAAAACHGQPGQPSAGTTTRQTGVLTASNPATHFFQGNAGQSVTLDLSSEDFDTYLTLYGPDGRVIAENDDSNGGFNSQIVTRLPATGTYRLEVRGFSNFAAGQYALTIAGGQFVSAGGHSNLGGLRQTGYLPRGGRNNHTFSGRSGQFVDLSLSSSQFDTYLTLYSPDGRILAHNDDADGGRNSRIRINLPQSGVYRLEVRGFGSFDEGQYTLLVGE